MTNKPQTLAEAFKALSDAIDVIDVNELIGQDDAAVWNDVLRKRTNLGKLITPHQDGK